MSEHKKKHSIIFLRSKILRNENTIYNSNLYFEYNMDWLHELYDLKLLKNLPIDGSLETCENAIIQ